MANAKFTSGREYSSGLQFQRRLREGTLIVVSAISVFLLLALGSYHGQDPSWSHTGVTGHVLNLGGYVGAWLSDVLLYSCGYVAYVFPFMLAYVAWLPFRHMALDDDDEVSGAHLQIMRVVGFVLILLAGSGLASLHLVPTKAHLPFSAGGILGDIVGYSMANVFSVFGSSWILLAVLLSGITLFTGLSWIQIADKLGSYTLKLIDFIGRCALKFPWYRLWPFWNRDDDVIPLKMEPTLTPNAISKQLTIERRAPIIADPRPISSSKRADKERQHVLFEPVADGSMPPLSLLDQKDRASGEGYTHQELEYMSRQVELHLRDFGIEVQVVAVHPGPVVTRFELQLAAGTKVSKISNLSKDLARSLSVISVRIVDVIPGKSVVGLELPNTHREVVRLREILSSKEYDQAKSPLTLALGKDVSGHPVIVDVAKMPHLLVAGTTGSGKSVGLNAMLLSLLYKSSPNDVRMILIDPKMLELSIYDGIPHLLTPVVTDMKEAANALRWSVAEMERRYRLMASLGVRNISGYNAKVKEAIKKGAPLLDPLWQAGTGEPPAELQTLPHIVVIADEFADMMMVVGKKVEELIARIAQKARAAGIHLILATQRPSVDVITGLIKANIPTRIAFQVSSKIDSRTILDQGGAEQLLGHGDMLYLPPGTAVPVRVHGAFVGDDEVHKVVRDLKSRGKPEYLDEILDGSAGGVVGIDAMGDDDEDAEKDAFYDQAVELIIQSRRASISSIQRRFKIGYNRAARIVEAMEAAGLVGPMENNGSREILVPAQAE